MTDIAFNRGNINNEKNKHKIVLPLIHILSVGIAMKYWGDEYWVLCISIFPALWIYLLIKYIAYFNPNRIFFEIYLPLSLMILNIPFFIFLGNLLDKIKMKLKLYFLLIFIYLCFTIRIFFFGRPQWQKIRYFESFPAAFFIFWIIISFFIIVFYFYKLVKKLYTKNQ